MVKGHYGSLSHVLLRVDWEFELMQLMMSYLI